MQRELAFCLAAVVEAEADAGMNLSTLPLPLLLWRICEQHLQQP